MVLSDYNEVVVVFHGETDCRGKYREGRKERLMREGGRAGKEERWEGRRWERDKERKEGKADMM